MFRNNASKLLYDIIESWTWNKRSLTNGDNFYMMSCVVFVLLCILFYPTVNSYILSTFVKARTAFHASVETLNSMPASSRPTVYNYFFRHKDLPSGGGEKAPQTYKAKTCHICNQKGHFALACPEKAASKERRKAVGNDRQQ